MTSQLIAILVLSICSLLIMLAFAVKRRLSRSQLLTIPQLPPENLSADPVELITRFEFLSGKNLETFQHLYQQQRYSDIQNLIAQRFHAQGKQQPERQAEEVCRKLFTPACQPVQHSQPGSA